MASPEQVEVYDFRRPTTLVREHARALELAFETFARQWTTQLTAKVRVISTVSVLGVAMHTYDEYAASLPPTTAMVLCDLAGLSSRAVVQISNTMALSWVGHMLGGTSVVTAPDRKFTQVESALITSLITETLDDLRYSLGTLLGTEITVGPIQHSAQFAQAAPTSELMIVAAFELRTGERTETGTVAIPADAILPQLGQINPSQTPEDAAHLVREQVQSLPVQVAVRLAPTTITPLAALKLAAGDVIRLPHHQSRPVEVTVGDKPLAKAALVQNGTRLAASIVETTQEN